MITAGYENTGVAEFISNEDQEVFPENTITIDMFANTFYRNYSYSADDNILVLFDVNPISQKAKIFIVSQINKALKSIFSYGKQYRMGSFEQTKIQLPVKNGSIDFAFMESFIAELEAERIAELEAERIAELEAYLSATGLQDYLLTVEEEKALKEFDNWKFEEYRIIDIFDVKNSGNILSRDIMPNSGTTPYLSASTENNAVSSYISYDEDYIDKGDCVFIGGKTFVVTYQEKDFYSNDSHNLILYLKEKEEKSKFNQLFLATCVKIGLGYKYSWGDSISNKKIQTDTFSLPSTKGVPAYAYMEVFIKAVQKLVIKEVVVYADRKIEATRKVVTKT